MQIAHGEKHFQDVGQALLHRQQGVVRIARGDLFERLAADVLHHDVAEAVIVVDVLDEVVDLDDPGMVDRGQELPFRDRDALRLRIRGIQQAFEDDGPVAHVAVDGQVDPAEAAVGDGAGDLVLVGDQCSGSQSRDEGVPGAAVAAVAGRGTGALALGSTDGFAAAPAEPLAVGDHRVVDDGVLGLDVGDLRHLDQAAAEPSLVHRRPTPRNQTPAERTGVGFGMGHGRTLPFDAVGPVVGVDPDGEHRCDGLGSDIRVGASAGPGVGGVGHVVRALGQRRQVGPLGADVDHLRGRLGVLTTGTATARAGTVEVGVVVAEQGVERDPLGAEVVAPVAVGDVVCVVPVPGRVVHGHQSR